MKRKAHESVRLESNALASIENQARMYQKSKRDVESDSETSEEYDEEDDFALESDDDESDDEVDTSNSEAEDDNEDASTSDEDEDEDKDIPLGQLLQMKQDGSTLKPRARPAQKKQQKIKHKRDDRHKPTEMSSKRPVPILRDSFQVAGSGIGGGKREIRDPRFEALTGGKFSDAAFKKRYSFIYDEKLPEERREIKEALRKTKSEKRKEELRTRLSRVTQQIKTEQARRKERDLEKKVMQQHKERISGSADMHTHTGDGDNTTNNNNTTSGGSGKKYYLKKSEKKKQMLLAKYEELKQSGQLDKYMEKRRKKVASKDHRLVPRSRRQNAE